MAEHQTTGVPAVHEGHISAGSQLPAEGQKFTGIDMAAETAKFDNAYGAVPGNPQSGVTGTSSSLGGDMSRDEQKEQAKQAAGEKKDELKDRHAKGESSKDIAKNEYKDASKEADKQTPDGHKPSIMEKIKAKIHKDT